MKNNPFIFVTFAGCISGACSRAPTPSIQLGGQVERGAVSPVSDAGGVSLQGSVGKGGRQTFRQGPPWGAFWCLRAEAFWSDELARRFMPLGVEVDIQYGPPQCRPDISAQPPDGTIAVEVTCGLSPLALWPENRGKATPLEGLGDVWAREEKLAKTRWAVEAWDADVPCHVFVVWRDPSRDRPGERAVELTKEVLKRLTPESIGRPRAELVYTAMDDTGDKAAAALAHWPTVKPAVDAIMTLAPGYPRVARSEEFPGMPPGKSFLLLGICRSRQGQNMVGVMMGIFPRPPPDPRTGVEVFHQNVDGLGLPIDCPDEVSAEDAPRGTSSDIWPLADQRAITVVAVENAAAKGGEVQSRFAAILFSPAREVLAIETGTVIRPADAEQRGRFWPNASKHYEKCSSGFNNYGYPMIAYGCDVSWSDYLCRGRKERETIVHDFTATPDNKLLMNRQEAHMDGTSCQAPE